MGKYVYIDKDSKKGRFGIGIGVFEILTKQALNRIPELNNDQIKANHHMNLNNSDIDIHRGVVRVRINVIAKKNVDTKYLEQRIVDEVNSSFMINAEQVPVEVKVRIEHNI